MSSLCISLFSVQSFAEGLGIPFLETSAKNASNVEEAFLTMTAELIKRERMRHDDDKRKHKVEEVRDEVSMKSVNEMKICSKS